MKAGKDVPFMLLTIQLTWYTLFGVYSFLPLTAAPLPKFDVPENCIWENNAALTCVYYLLGNAPAIRLNFTRSTSDHITSINIICKSSESDGQINATIMEDLIQLWKLRELRIIGCRFSYWPANLLDSFRDLRNLTIKTMNDRRSKLSFELQQGAFNMTPLIEKIDLSFSNIWQLPESIFCPLSNLVGLDVSWNTLKDIRELGFSDIGENVPIQESKLTVLTFACTLDIQNLDASNNHISVLPSFGFSALKRLKTLNISGNIISMVDDAALWGLRSLEVFDLSSNKIVALPAEMFKDTRNTLKELRLQNNSISALAPGLVIEMNQLVSLDLSKNSLTSSWLNSGTFTGLIRLVLLNLSFNKISKLDPALFKDLYTLQILNLHHNDINTIPADTFSPMSNLHTLNLAHNKLKYLDAYSLNGLYAVSLLSLDSNILVDIHPDAFMNCSSMQDLNLSGNNLESVPIALKDMRMLRRLDLGENVIKSMNQPGFQGMSSLYGLRMIGNEISNLTRNNLAEMPALQILNLARNKIENIEIAAFSNNPLLQAIRLDVNYIQDITGIFSNAPSLLWLNISDNLIKSLEYNTLPTKIQWLDLHKNQINHLGIPPPNFHLQTLDISFNRLTRIHPTSVPNSIELLFINDNWIHTIEPQTFYDKENLTRVDLYANQIVKMDLSVFQLGQVPDSRELPEFYIGGNPFICDCTMEWLQRINSLPMRKHPKIMDLDSVYCRLPYDRIRSFIPLLDAKPSQFLCTYNAHCFALCHCCDFDACDCKMTCPINCTCYHDQSWAANVVDCSNSGYKKLPGRLPMDATEVYLDGNDFGELTSHSFIGRKNLEILYANNSNIITIHNHTFSGLKRLIILHLENNKIEKLSGVELLPLENLKELYLQNNVLSHLDNNTFLALRHLEVLMIDNNRLSDFALWQLAFNPYIVDISISNNPWLCECTYLEQVHQWMSKNKDKITDWKWVMCELGMPIMISTNESAISCTSLTKSTSSIETRHLEAYLPFVLSIVIFCFAIAVLICNGFKHRRRIKSWAASKCGLRACYKTAAFEDREKPFDAYISYSAVDENFVSRVLVPGLESSYRLCLHYRDLGIPGNVADAVTAAADASRRTILILSRNFLHGEWERFEFKSALRDALRGKGRSVILLLIGGVCLEDLDTDLRKRISSHTVLVWEDKLFWQKLKFAMPEVSPIAVLERPLPLPPPPPPPVQHLWT